MFQATKQDLTQRKKCTGRETHRASKTICRNGNSFGHLEKFLCCETRHPTKILNGQVFLSTLSRDDEYCCPNLATLHRIISRTFRHPNVAKKGAMKCDKVHVNELDRGSKKYRIEAPKFTGLTVHKILANIKWRHDQRKLIKIGTRHLTLAYPYVCAHCD